MFLLSLLIVGFSLIPLVGIQTLHAADSIDFDRDVRPILSDKCYFCHGPDPEHREADLRFDIPDGPADVIASGEFLRRISSDDPYERMPPPEAKVTLSEDDKRVLRAWAEAGAPYAAHWAFTPLPAEVPLPEVRDPEWARQPWDKFVLAKLDAEGLHPAKEAAPLRWLRRVTFDLTGLPPTVEEIEGFLDAVAHDREAAYRAVVDRLLASPALGEHMAVTWLDAARYADSYGYQSDKLNTQWPYRDWVVRAFNENLPYDKFLTWQLAGDLLDNPTTDQRLATAFNRLHRLTNEGGAIFEEWRIENVADRVQTFGTAILGLTVECARCHDHKFDPISQRDFYSLSAFFNSIDENGLYDSTAKVPSPSMLLPTAAEQAALKKSRAKVAAAEQAYQVARAGSDQRMQQWLGDNPQASLQIPDLKVALDFDEPFDESEKEVYFPATDNRQQTSDLERVEVTNPVSPRVSTTGGVRRALVFDGDRGMTLPAIEAIDRWTPFSLVVTLREPRRQALREVIAHHAGGTDAGYNGWDLTINDGYVESRLYRVWPGNAIGVRTADRIPADAWVQLAATYDGSSRAAGLKLFVNGKELATEVLRDKITKSANLLVKTGGGLVIGQRFRARGFTEGMIDDVRYYNRALTPGELLHLATGPPLKMSPEYFQSAVDPVLRDASAQLTAARQELVSTEEPIQEVPIMEETREPRETHILARGRYDAPTSDETRVTRDTFEKISPPFPEDAPRNRLGLAQWLTQPDHPLTARVEINRLWQNFFGAGLVRTPENFGLQGELPTHPELLDWLSRDLIDHGWDIKRCCRNIVLSATYRQDSAASRELWARDPENRLLARGPAHRLSAEQLRDLALVASGLINRQFGGPPVSPYQAGGDLWKESNAMSPPYQQSVGKALYRRSVYSVWKRTAPLPNMTAFDTPSREVCTVRRSRTNTPLQALVLLNDVQFVEAARALATAVTAQHSDPIDRVRAAFLALGGREPDSDETQLLLDLLRDEADYYAVNPDEAEQLIRLGDLAVDSRPAADELAAMTVVCQAILNLDATVWQR